MMAGLRGSGAEVVWQERNITERKGHLQGVAALVVADVLWGSTFVVNRGLVSGTGAGHVSPEMVMAVRFCMAAVVMSPWLRWDWRLILVAAELGVWDWMGYYFQVLGLRTAGASVAAFLTNLTVVIVPLIGTVGRKRIGMKLWMAALVAFLGVGLLASSEKGGAGSVAGDLWVVGCAVAYAVFILRLESASRKFPAVPLTAWLMVAVSVISIGSVVATGEHVALGGLPWGTLVYLGILTTALTAFLQTYGQGRVSATEAAVIFCLEPLFASVFAMVMLQEFLGLSGWVGCGLVLGGAILSSAGDEQTE